MTTQYKETIINVLTGETTERLYTPAEIAEVEKEIEASQIEAQKIAEKEAARTAVLTKLGITAEEAIALLS